jgi:hypothetical protein
MAPRPGLWVESRAIANPWVETHVYHQSSLRDVIDDVR